MPVVRFTRNIQRQVECPEREAAGSTVREVLETWFAASAGVQDPHLLAQCRANPEVVWTQHHNGIFVSRDGARTCQ